MTRSTRRPGHHRRASGASGRSSTGWCRPAASDGGAGSRHGDHPADAPLRLQGLFRRSDPARTAARRGPEARPGCWSWRWTTRRRRPSWSPMPAASAPICTSSPARATATMSMRSTRPGRTTSCARCSTAPARRALRAGEHRHERIRGRRSPSKPSTTHDRLHGARTGQSSGTRRPASREQKRRLHRPPGGGVADPHLARDEQIGVGVHRRQPAASAAAQSASVIAGLR
jgi:hypothetical protein